MNTVIRLFIAEKNKDMRTALCILMEKVLCPPIAGGAQDGPIGPSFRFDFPREIKLAYKLENNNEALCKEAISPGRYEEMLEAIDYLYTELGITDKPTLEAICLHSDTHEPAIYREDGVYLVEINHARTILSIEKLY